MEKLGFSERRACGLIGLGRSTLRYRSRRAEDPGLLERMKALAQERPRFGYRRLLVLVQRAGEGVNHKRFDRLYRRERLPLPRRRPRRALRR
ncbi:MAG: IS3 family transposase, partial [Actinomycetota bacterium]